MPRQEGLRPIGESVKKIIEKIKKEREERQKKSSSPRTQPKLPGMVKGGDVKGYMSGGFGIFSKKKSDKKESNESKKKKRLEELKKEIGMKRGGGVDMGDPKKPVAIPTGKDPEIMVHNLRPSDDPDFRAYAGPRRTGKDKIEKLKADLKKKPMKKMAIGGITEDDSEFSRRRKQGPNRGGLTRGQKKIDANRDGKISGDDFKILRSKQKMKGGGIAIKGTNFKGVF